ncbi:hypothetical protein ZHAS_00013532 [Anopheles sinensis]|uniref:Uncharacterized protein n=1 Tax=Anopheles sinensis TaxID=74873 RepID=A0A084W629_ANOSI|nr:hypothetical protein ZHAS_00013532 [Anopheles sinensis]
MEEIYFFIPLPNGLGGRVLVLFKHDKRTASDRWVTVAAMLYDYYDSGMPRRARMPSDGGEDTFKNSEGFVFSSLTESRIRGDSFLPRRKEEKESAVSARGTPRAHELTIREPCALVPD